MKIRLWCRIFGHKFLARVSVIGEPFGVYTPMNYCINCGLSKKEIKELEK